MAYKKKTVQEAPPAKATALYEITASELRGQVNDVKYTGKAGDVLEMEPWVAQILAAYVKEVQQ